MTVVQGPAGFRSDHGSVARGEDRAQSDIDLLVVADDVQLEDLFARIAPVERKLGRKINPHCTRGAISSGDGRAETPS